MHMAAGAIQQATTDVGEGARSRALENSYMWLTDKAEMTKKQKPELQKVTIAEGMKKTGGYVGTDLDMQIQQEMSQYEQQHLGSLQKKRRLLREKVLCAENCQFDKWSFNNGISLNEHCPIDCPVYKLNTQFRKQNSMAAMLAYQSFGEIKDQAKNKADLASLESAIDQETLEMQKTNKMMVQHKADLN